MRIFRLQAENVRNLIAVDITPPADGSAVVIRGNNGAGKSTILDSIGMAITGKKINRPIRKGQPAAKVTVTLDDYIVTRTWTEKSGDAGYLKVQTKEGAAVKSPQALMDKIKGEIGFDPLEFASYTGKKRVDVLKALAKLDFTEHDTNRQKIYDERTLVNRDLKNVDGQLAGLPEPAADVAEEAPSPKAAAEAYQTLADQVRGYDEWASEFEGLRKNYEALVKGKASLEAEIAEQQARLVEIEKAIAAAIENGKDLESIKPFCPTPDALEKARETLAKCELVGEAVRAAQQYRTAKTRRDELATEAAELTKLLEEADAEKAKAIAEAKYPIEGLAIDEDSGDATYNGILFDQLSSGEQIRASTSIGMALNPDLRVLTVHDGSLLDEDGHAVLRKTTFENDYQLWEEVVGEGGVGIILEAGTIKEIRK